MFGKQNNNQNTSASNTLPGVDPRNLRTFISPSFDDVQKKASVDIALPSARASQEVVQKDFVQSKEEEEKKQPEVPETSPFFSAEKESPAGASSQNSSDITSGIRVGFENNSAPSGEQKPEEKVSVVEIPKENTAQKSSFQPISSTRTVSESALSGRLSVGNYTGRDGSGVVRAKEVKNDVLKGSVFKIMFVLLIVVLVGLIAWGGYYYWKSRSVTPPVEEVPVIVTDPVTTPTTPQVPAFPYNWKMANAIIVDEASGKTPITELRNAVRELSTYQGDGVLEFYFVDNTKNLTDISSKELVNKLGITFSDRVKNLLKESGEGKLYLSKKGLDIRVVLALEVTDRDSALAGFLASEEGITANIAPLYLGGIDTTTVKAHFTDYVYSGYAIRYFNIDIAKNYSLDYGFRRDTAFFATSKDSLRQVWDVLDGKEHPASVEGR